MPEYDELMGETVAVGMCDGVTESMLAKDWAALLAESAAHHAALDERFFEGSSHFEEFTRKTVGRWAPWLDSYTAHRVAEGNPLKWYEHTKLASGASATLLALRLTPRHDGAWAWRCAALGDSCVFHLRGDVLLRSFPLQKPEEFGVTPDLFSSRNHDSALLSSRTRYTRGVCESGDRLLMMTDALAAWFLATDDHSAAMAQLLEFGGPHDARPFEAWLNQLRAEGELRNDDVALVRIDIEGQ
ncbi:MULTISPECIES: hypothetical protein [unclassified Streptomyces]|uniref:hypothetical protein n=1 Tax=unclassified Streptomyces TaxID=2593676 RepID=UPI00380F8A3D